jgi:hypothetical protein
VKLSRLRSGEAIAAIGALALAGLLALDWFLLSTPDARVGAHESGIRALGWFADLVLVFAVLIALALASFTVTHRAPGVPVMLAIMTTLFGFLGFVSILVRLLAQPGLGVDAGNADVDLELPAFLGLVAAAAITFGGWRTMADERTDAPESVEQTEDVLRVRGAARPAPPRTIGEA